MTGRLAAGYPAGMPYGSRTKASCIATAMEFWSGLWSRGLRWVLTSGSVFAVCRDARSGARTCRGIGRLRAAIGCLLCMTASMLERSSGQFTLSTTRWTKGDSSASSFLHPCVWYPERIGHRCQISSGSTSSRTGTRVKRLRITIARLSPRQVSQRGGAAAGSPSGPSLSKPAFRPSELNPCVWAFLGGRPSELNPCLAVSGGTPSRA